MSVSQDINLASISQSVSSLSTEVIRLTMDDTLNDGDGSEFENRNISKENDVGSQVKRQETQEEESGTDTEDSEMKEKVNRRKVAVKEKRNKKNKIISINIIIKICL